MNAKKVILFLLLIFSAGLAMAQITITKSVTQLSCNNTGSASVTASGGVPPYTYEWRLDQGTVFSTAPSVTGLTAGYYSILVTDANNDFAMDSVTMNNGINAYFSNYSDAVCPLSNGSATVAVTGGSAPYSYLWSNGSTTNAASGLAGGTKVQVQVMDANGCYANFYTYSSSSVLGTTVGEMEIGTVSTINATYSSVPEQCPLKNGSITLTTSGGTPPYTYYWNTSPVKNTPIISGLTAGTYVVTIRDADGCLKEVNTTVNLNPGSLNVTATKVNDYCSKLQDSATLTITGGVPPYTIQWPDGSNGLTKSGLGYGFHTAIVTDQNSCAFYRDIFIEDLSPVTTWITPTETACDNISGSALANVIGGAAPYTYHWSNGGTSSSIHSLPKGYYSVQVTDANGCKGRNWATVEINSSCYGYISGKIYQDNNGNCVQDIGDYVIMNNWAQLNANTSPRTLYDGYSCTGLSGTYSMRYVLPDQYTVSFSDITERTAACPSSGVHQISIATSGVNYPDYDFAMQPSTLDQNVSLRQHFDCLSSVPRPGFDYSYAFTYKNNGTLPANGFIEVVYSDYETFLSSSPAADYYDPATKTLRFNYSSLMLGEIRMIRLEFNTPVATLLGTNYTHIITADVGGTDLHPEDNTMHYPFTVVGSFDPNDLAVFPEGALAEKDSVLTYTIRFQNTGTYYAELVVIKDTLDENLDMRTVSDITASHPVNFRLLEDRAIEFAFPNIHLPDSNRNEPESHGFVTFNIKRNKNLSPGTLIHNRAEIYFDFNAPVVTNTTTNNIPFTTGIVEKSMTSGKVYPNPAKDFTAFSFETEISRIQLMNATGRVVMTQSVPNEKEFSLKFNLSKGMYFYTANTREGTIYSGKLIVE